MLLYHGLALKECSVLLRLYLEPGCAGIGEGDRRDLLYDRANWWHVSMATRLVLPVGSATNAFITVWNRFMKLGDNWYKQNADWDLCKQKMENLRKDMEMWMKEARDRGMSHHEELTRCLNDAREMLEKEEKDRTKKEANRCRKIKRAVFPALVEDSLKQVEYAFDNILKTFVKKDDARAALDNEMERGILLQCVDHDPRYVHLRQTESILVEALMNNNGPTVVLLEGGGGTGKSTVAGYMAASFNPNRNKDSSTFDCVHVLDCGYEASIHFTKLLHQLIQRLGSTPRADPKAEETSPSILLENQFQHLLDERQMLLVLDNLRDAYLLLRMIRMSVKGLKILVTGQLDVCRSLVLKSHYVYIRIQDVDNYTAGKILAAHAGFSNHEIPVDLLTHAYELMVKTDRNPLALATLGAAISGNRDTDSEWATLSRNPSLALKSKKAPSPLFLRRNSRTLWSTLELNIKQNLSEGARKLLLLAYASNIALKSYFIDENNEDAYASKPSVPEVIIQVIYNRVQGDEGILSSFRRELEDLQLITSSHYDDYNNHPIKMWSLHSLQKLYIEDDDGMRAARDSVLDTLIDTGATAEQPEDAILLDLVADFMNADLARKATAKRDSLQCSSSDAVDGGGLPPALADYRADLRALIDENYGFYRVQSNMEKYCNSMIGPQNSDAIFRFIRFSSAVLKTYAFLRLFSRFLTFNLNR